MSYKGMKELCNDILNGDENELNDVLDKLVSIKLVFKNGIAVDFCNGLNSVVTGEVDAIKLNIENHSFIHYMILEDGYKLHDYEGNVVECSINNLDEVVNWSREETTAKAVMKLSDFIHFIVNDGFNLELKPGMKIEIEGFYFLLEKPIIVNSNMVDTYIPLETIDAEAKTATVVLSKDVVNKYIPLEIKVTKSEKYLKVVIGNTEQILLHNGDLFSKVNTLLLNDGYIQKKQRPDDKLVETLFDLNKPRDVETNFKRKYVKYVRMDREKNIRKTLLHTLRKIDSVC